MTRPPSREFGKRKPEAVPAAAAPPVKRSGHVALLLMGTFAIGGGAYALTPRNNCEPKSPGVAAPSLPQTSTACSSGSSSGSHGGSWSRRSSFFGGDSASSGSSSGATAESGSGGVTRGGFGSFARSFASHFSFGG